MEVEIDYLAIGKRIRTARLSKKMTQETLSNMIDVAPTYVSSIENGHTKLSLATLLGIAQSLDTTVDQLLYDNTPVLVSKFDADIKELTSDCSNQEKEFLLEIIKSTKTALRNYKPVTYFKDADTLLFLHPSFILLRSCFLAILY